MYNDIKAASRLRNMRGPALLRLLGTYLAALLLLILAGMSTLAAWRMYGRMAQANEGEVAAKRQFAMAEYQQAQVAGDLERLSSPQGSEGELRRRYGVARPGEGVIKVIESDAVEISAVTYESADIFARIWHAIFSW